MLTQQVKDEIEDVTHMLISGNVAVVVASMFRGTSNVDALIKYLRGGNTSATLQQEPTTPSRQESDNRFCFENWFNQFEEL